MASPTAPVRFDRLTDRQKLARFRRAVSAGKRWREEQGYDEMWKSLLAAYRLKYWSDQSKFTPQEGLQINIAFATINVIEPSVAVNHPHTWVYPRDPDNIARAAISEAVLDYLWKSNNTHPEFRAGVKDSLIFGLGWLKTGYRFREEAEPMSDEDREAALGQLNAELDEKAVADPEGAINLPTPDEAAASIPDVKMRVVEDRPFLERVSPFNIYVDPAATSERDMRWIAQRIVRSWEAVRFDPRYDRRARGRVNPTRFDKGSPGEDVLNLDDAEAGAERAQVVVWEFYDVEHSTVAVFADGCDEFLIAPTKIPYKFGHPFIMVPGYDVPDCFFPIGDLEAIMPLQAELNETRTQLRDARKHFIRKYFMPKGVLSQQARAALESDVDGQIVEVDAGDRPIGELMAPIPVPNIPPELFNLSQQLQSETDLVSGVSDYQRGSAPEIRRTATEAALIQDAVNARTADRLAKIERAIAEVSKRFLCLAQQYMTGEQVARVASRSGKQVWISYDHDDLSFEADFEVEAGSTQPKNEAFKQQQANQLLQVAMPFVQMGVVDPRPMFMWVMQQFGIKNPEQFVTQQQPMMPGMPPGMGMPPGAPPGAAPPEGAEPPETGGPPPDGIPPELLAQLAGQVGVGIPSMMPQGAAA